MLSIEELLQPRIKMIAPIPKVFSCGIEVGQIWTAEDAFFNLTGAHRIGLVEIKKYPHLFKELSWWEERKVEDMPQYIKNIADGRIDKFLKVVPNELYPRRNTARIYLDGGKYEYIEDKRAIPATEKEYLEYQSLNQIN